MSMHRCGHCESEEMPIDWDFIVDEVPEGMVGPECIQYIRFYCSVECKHAGELAMLTLEKDAHARAAIIWGYISLVLITIALVYWL